MAIFNSYVSLPEGKYPVVREQLAELRESEASIFPAAMGSQWELQWDFPNHITAKPTFLLLNSY